ncbi:hypothetical protein KIPE111705_03085 [Kibdelosporangium persicum]|uniref:Uncharacterized protein n=1 Tax=Kibdelosporangium persicum TaxID=2698649 RepID=A0ABX2F8C4_9PSEU|nr:hypothetical protein [Kibdelosporangium persicum]NRN67458.1 hypothetical protein [Kibdelosporangium persicum]
MRRLLALSAVIAVTFLAAPSVASAGGPTSVIITSPSEGEAAARYTNQADYTQLNHLLGDQPSADPQAPDLRGGPGSRSINVTWLIHDVQVWRVDHVFLDRPDGIWVQTIISWERVTLDQRGVVHRPANQEALAKLLNGILATPVTQASVQTTAAAPPAPPANGLQWTSLLIGAVCGVVLAVAGRVLLGLLSRRQA